jgi:hypothetical protein
MDPEKMAKLEQEADQLTGILVTILKNSEP